MVIPKGNVNVRPNRAGYDPPPWRHAGVKSFKVHTDSDVDSRGRAVTDAKQRILATTSGSKGASGDLPKGRGKNFHSGPSASIGRKALADISNVNKSSLKNATQDGRKLKILMGQSAYAAEVATRKSSTGNVGDSLKQCLTDRLKVGVKHEETSSDIQKTKVECTANGRVNARNACLPTRKSLPVLRRVDNVETENIQETSGDSKKSKENRGFLVKTKVGTKVVPRAKNAKDHLDKNRVSDGCLLMDKSEANKDSNASFRKSIKPVVRTTVRAPNAQRTSKSVCIVVPKRSTHIASVTSNNKEEASTSLCNNSGPDVKSGRDMKILEICSRKSQRRRSFTSMLVTRSKLLEDPGVAVKQEKLPNIDDDRNHLEVAEYVDDIYQYYWAFEAQNRPLDDYLSAQTQISPHMRGILVNWLIEVHFRFNLMPETLYLMVTLLDRYLSLVIIRKNEMQLVGLTSLLLASKYEDFWHPRIEDLINISAESYTRDHVLRMEKLILNKLKFRLNAPTPYVFMLRFLKAAQSSTKLEHLAFYLAELSLVEYEALKFKPSMLCAAAVYVAHCTLHKSPPWTRLLVKHTHYEISQIRECAEVILKIHKGARTRQLSVTYEKYTGPELGGVAHIKPLGKLPQ